MKYIKNTNEAIVNAIEGRLKVTEGQCPCVPQDQWNQDTMCPCRAFREEDYCCCKLYIGKE